MNDHMNDEHSRIFKFINWNLNYLQIIEMG